MNNKIRHEGIIDNIDGDCVHVRILQTSACASCKVAGHCNAAESKVKMVDVYHTDTTNLQPGDVVVVSASGDVAARALLWAFGLPFLLMVSVLLIVLWKTKDEGVAALSGLLALVPYYGLLFLLRHSIQAKIAFTLEK